MLTQDLGIATAYGYAKSKGYTGTEEEFAELMASYADVAESAEASAESASSSASDSEAYAVGKRGGTDVESEDVAYHNNAKYYASQAGSSASSASSDASSASSSKSDAEAYAVGKRNGTDVESSDVAYHNNAKYYSEQASDSASTATNAKDTAVSSKDTAVSKAGEASTSAGTATTKAGEASASATSANAAKLVSEGYAVGKQNGTDVESGSPYYENNAKYYAEQAEETLHEYARIDGYYEDLTAGNAEQLTTDIRANDQTPYLFRTAGGSVDIGDREYINGIVGGTVAWNQLLRSTTNTTTTNGITFTKNNDGTVNVSGTATANAVSTIHEVPLFGGHTYLLMGCPSGGAAGKYALYANQTDPQLFDVGSGSIKKQNADTTGSFYIIVYSGQTVDLTFIPQLFDLTQMFGSTIADYIYSLEQANAGAGVAFFKTLFPKPYYAYNSGELKSVSGLVSHDMIGFNAWDEEWEVGSIDGGNPTVANDRIRSKNYIPVVGGATYYTTGRICWYEYDADKNFIKVGNSGSFVENETFTVSNNCAFIKFKCTSAYGTTYNHDICINLSWDGSEDGNYEPYQKWSYPLDSDLELRGIPKIENGNLYYDGDVYEADGTVTRKYGIVDLGTLDWSYVEATHAFRTYGISNLIDPNATSVLCQKYPCYYDTDWHTLDKLITTWASYKIGNIIVKDTAYSDATAFKTAMNGVYLVYELATPTTETADPYTSPQIVDDFGTEEFVISNTVDVPIPVGHNTDYPINLKAKVEMAPNSPDGDGDYIVRQTSGTNEYVALANNATIQNILARLEALEGGN